MSDGDTDGDGICNELQGTVSDLDGNTYKTIKIDDQWWMAENLKVTHYNNEDEIPTGLNNNSWGEGVLQKVHLQFMMMTLSMLMFMETCTTGMQ